jgi:VanZ family protein
MLHKLYAAIAWTSLAFITWATLSPIRERPHLPTSVHFEHLLGFAFLGIVFVVAHPQRTTLVSSIVLGSAVLLEYLQTFTPDRHGRLIDALDKIVGGSLGILVATVALLCIDRTKGQV